MHNSITRKRREKGGWEKVFATKMTANFPKLMSDIKKKKKKKDPGSSKKQQTG